MNDIKDPHIGIDESGKGDFFGPLIICALFVSSNTIQKQLVDIGVRDSKQIKNDASIINLSNKICDIVSTKNYRGFDVICINPPRYNKLYDKIKNLNAMLAWGHRTAMYNLLSSLKENEQQCDTIISDRFSKKGISNDSLIKKFPELKLIQHTHAEDSYISVAAASIIARSYFIGQLQSLYKIFETQLSRGSGPKTLELAVKLIKKFGQDKMNLVAKTHFKTFRDASLIALQNST